MKKIFKLLPLLGLLVVIGCSDDDDVSTPLETFNVALNCTNSIPVVTGRNETGTAILKLYEDNRLEFSIAVDGLVVSDHLSIAHLHSGNVVSTGGVEITLVDDSNVSFSANGKASGSIQLTQSQASFLRGDDVYINIHSHQHPMGLLRGQVDQEIDGAYNTLLSPGNEIPAVVGRAEDGLALIRTVGNTMYYKIEVNNLAATDAINAGHIHLGTSSENGSLFLNLAIGDNSQLGVTKSLQLSNDELTTLRSASLYVNIHSIQQASGLMRGQLRE